jgi:hypothetical protein
MIRSVSLLVLLAVVASSSSPAQDLLQGPKWTPLEFHVQKTEEGENALREFNRGTHVVARLELLGQKFVAIDMTKCKLDSFTDDKNTDLLAAPAARPLSLAISNSTVLGGKPNDINFQAPGCPVKGATKVHIKGTIIALVGKDEKEVEKKDVALKDGLELEMGGIKLQLAKATGFGKTAADTRLTCTSERPVISVTILDGDGKELPCRSTLSFHPSATGKGTTRGSITITGTKVERCTLRIKYFDSVEEVKVPVDLEVGPGL